MNAPEISTEVERDKMSRRWLLLAAFGVLLAAPIATGAAETSQQRAKTAQTTDAASKKEEASILELKQATGLITTKMDRLAADQLASSKEISELKTRLDETTWKAIDGAFKVSNLKWQIAAITITVTLTALGLVFTVLGWGAYKLMHDKLEGELRKELNDDLQKGRQAAQRSMREMTEMSRHRIESGSLGTISLAFFYQHVQVLGSDEPSLSEKARNLEAALSLSRLALAAAEKLDNSEPEHEALLAIQRSNRAYYLADMANLINKNPKLFEARAAEAAKKKEAEVALELARSLLPIATKYRDKDDGDWRWPHWLESYCWVLRTYGNALEKETANNLIRELYNHKVVAAEDPEDLRPWIRDRYFSGQAPA